MNENIVMKFSVCYHLHW